MLKLSRILNVGQYDVWCHYIAGWSHFFSTQLWSRGATLHPKRLSLILSKLLGLPIHTQPNVEDDSPWDSDPESMGEACLHQIRYCPVLHSATCLSNKQTGTSLSKGAAFPTYSNHLMQDSNHWTTNKRLWRTTSRRSCHHNVVLPLFLIPAMIPCIS
jgi:hypothetical protein